MQTQSESVIEDVLGEKSIAVLPFRNISSDAENEYFSDGITEEIMNALTKVEGLAVIARSSAFKFKNQDIDSREVGKLLKVAFILEGSVRKAGNKVRVSAQLIKSKDGFYIFSEVYDRELKDIFEVQDDISNKIVQKLTENLDIRTKGQKLATTSTENIEAFELYLKGRFNLSKGSLEATKVAIQYFEAAIRKDEKFVLPVTGLAACFTFLGGSGLMPVSEAFEKVRQYANRTNVLDENVAETHLALAKSAFWCDWDFETTRNSIKKAIQLNPGISNIHGFNSVFLMACGRIDEALVEAHLAIKLDPLSLKSKSRLGELYFRSRRYLDAIEIFDDILKENSFFSQASIFKAWSHILLGDPELGIRIMKNIPITRTESMTFYGGVGYAYARLGQYDKILEFLQKYNAKVKSGKVQWLNYNYTLLFRALGETDKMFEYLQKCLEQKDTPLIFINVDPIWDEFRDDSRFTRLLEKTFDPDKRDHVVRIKTDTKEELALNLNKLVYIEAQENYSKVVWISEGKPVEKLLRVTLKRIEDQIVNNHIVRCHRSYIINTKFNFIIRGNSNGYRLKSSLFSAAIPISRTLGKEIISKLKAEAK